MSEKALDYAAVGLMGAAATAYLAVIYAMLP